MTRRTAFKQSDMTRALRATKAAGVEVKRIEIEPDGKIVVVTDRTLDEPGRNEWEAVK